MTKQELIEKLYASFQIHGTARLTREDVKKVVDISLAVIEDELIYRSDNVRLSPLGMLKTVKRAPRVSRNPKTGEPVELPERRIIRFYPSARLKEKLKA